MKFHGERGFGDTKLSCKLPLVESFLLNRVTNCLTKASMYVRRCFFRGRRHLTRLWLGGKKRENHHQESTEKAKKGKKLEKNFTVREVLFYGEYMNDCTDHRVLLAKEYADFVRVNPQTIRGLLRKEEIPHYRFVASRRIPNPNFAGEPLPEVMTLQEFADEFRLSKPTVRKGIEECDIRALKLGGVFRIWPPPEPAVRGCGTDSPTKNRQPHTSEEPHEQSN